MRTTLIFKTTSDILGARYTNVGAENALVSEKKESYSWTIKLATLEEKINVLSKENEYLKGEIESYQKVIRLMANEISNKTDINVWKTVSNQSQKVRKTNLVNEIDHLVILLNNVYKPLNVDLRRESSKEHDDESTLKETETQRSTNLSKNNIQRNITNRQRPEHCITDRCIKPE